MFATVSDIEKAVEQIALNVEPTSFVIEVSYLKRKNEVIRVVMDADGGIKLEQIVKINRAISSYIDEHFSEWKGLVEVFSPGIGNPFKSIRQYNNNIGRKLILLFLDGNTTEGVLQEVTESGILVCRTVKDPKTKKKTTENLHVEFARIKEAKVEVTF